MLTKEQFIKYLDFYEQEQIHSDKLNIAIQNYTESDTSLSGFLNNRLLEFLIDWLKEVMHDDTYIEWYYETPLSNIECHTIYTKKEDGITKATIINSKEKLYDLITHSSDI